MTLLKFDNKLAVGIVIVAAVCGLIQCVRVEVSYCIDRLEFCFEFSRSLFR